MMEWLSANGWVVWLCLAGVLAVSEMLTLDLTLLMLASGALAGGIAGFFLPGLLWVQVVVAVVVAVTMLFVLRPVLLKRLSKSPGYRSSASKVVGGAGIVTQQVTAAAGEVKVAGETWSARSFDGSDIEQGVEIEVFEIDGLTAVVYPRYKSLS